MSRRRYEMRRMKRRFLLLLRRLFSRRSVRIGIYGPPNAGKTTLANRMIRDFSSGEGNFTFGEVSEIPHETRTAIRNNGIEIRTNKGGRLKIDIVDTPGLATKIDFHDFLPYGLSEEEAKERAKQGTEGVIEAIKWLDELDGILLVLDSTEDPYIQANIVIIGNLEAKSIPFIIVANKNDLKEASPSRIKNAFPQHVVVSISALKGDLEELYEEMVKNFR